MNDLDSKIDMGFTYVIEHIRDGVVIDAEKVHNIIPIEGLNHMMGVTFKAVTQVATWYLALYEGNYSPTSDLTAATFPALATETTAYTPASRVEFNEGAVAGGSVDNSANKAQFTFTAAKTVYGGAILSSSVRGAVSGVIMSAVRFPSPKVLAVGDVLQVTAGNLLVSA